MVMNTDQDQFACEPDTSPGMSKNTNFCNLMNTVCSVSVFDGCPFEVDGVWGITWPNTERNSSNTQLCPGGHDALGTSFLLISSC